MQADLLLVNPAQTAEVGGAQGLWIVDPELLNKEDRLDVFPTPSQSFSTTF